MVTGLIVAGSILTIAVVLAFGHKGGGKNWEKTADKM